MVVFSVDIGTTSLSALALDAEAGRALGGETRANPGMLSGLPPYARCQDADALAGLARAMIDALTDRFGRPAAIGLTGQMHGIVYLDARGHAVSPLYTWQDARGELEAEGGERCAARLSRLTGYPLATGYGAVTHDWLMRHQQIPPEAVSFCCIADYAGMRLTGRKTPLQHASHAASVGLYDPHTGAFDGAAIARADLDARYFPQVTRDLALLGEMDAGVPVAVAIGDNQASYLGSVADPERSVLINMGTGGQISMLAGGESALRGGCAGEDGQAPSALCDDCTEASSAPCGDCASADKLPRADGLERRPLNGDQAILVGSTLCGGRAYALLERFFASCAALSGTDAGASLYEAMNILGERAMDDRADLVVDTRFEGTRVEPHLRGCVAHIGTDNFDAAHLIAGTVRGMADELYTLYQAMRARGAASPDCLIGAGNGVRKNPLLRRALAERFSLPLRLPAHREEGTYGAAFFAMAAAGIAPDLRGAQRLIRYE